MPPRFDASLMMFVFLRGHHLLDYYFAVADSRRSANEPHVAGGGDEPCGSAESRRP